MTIIELKGYIVRFCTDHDYHQPDSCPNYDSKSNKYFISPYGAQQITKSIKTRAVPLVIGHDKQGNAIGWITNAELTKHGIVVKGYIDDKQVITAFKNQYNIYISEYTKNISFEQYLKNIFSSISLSHDPNTWHINHIGLVNIPARLGTAVTYIELKGNSIDRNIKNINDLITTHCVAFLRSPNRNKILNINDSYSYSPNSSYITASIEYNNNNIEEENSMEAENNFLKSILKKMLDNKLTNDNQQQQPLVDSPNKKRQHEEPSDHHHEIKKIKIEEPKQVDSINHEYEHKLKEMSERMSAMSEMSEKMSERMIILQDNITTLLNERQAPPPQQQYQPQPQAVEASHKYDQGGKTEDEIDAIITQRLYNAIKEISGGI